MINLYELIKDNIGFKKLVVNDLLFVEYTCIQEETKFGLWSNSNYFAFILSGKKSWRSIYQTYEVEEGDILFIKKGANLTHQFFGDQFCAIFIFIPDSFITTFLKKNASLLRTPQKNLSEQDSVLRVKPNSLLTNYSMSIMSFLSIEGNPDEKLINHKLEELLFSLFSKEAYRPLTDYFISLCQSETYHMTRVIEENFAYNLKLEDYAQLCHMSLSAFKSAFQDHYQASPAKWIKNKKLELALHKILTSELTVGQIAFECGFQATSHFIRVFKQKYSVTPLEYRQKHVKTE